MTPATADAQTQGQARRALRAAARSLRQQPSHTGAHFARLHAALSLPGNEPAQGCLADLFAAVGAEQSALKRAALELVAHRLAPHVRHWFEAMQTEAALPRINPLATRWSVLAIPSADMATRARRVSADDSRALAAQAVAAVHAADRNAQEAFFHHCLTCHDNLAFMLARRQLLREGTAWPAGWDAVSAQLEQVSA